MDVQELEIENLLTFLTMKKIFTWLVLFIKLKMVCKFLLYFQPSNNFGQFQYPICHHLGCHTFILGRNYGLWIHWNQNQKIKFGFDVVQNCCMKIHRVVIPLVLGTIHKIILNIGMLSFLTVLNKIPIQS
jgi:hypothetical protein